MKTGKPGRACTICINARRPEIDAALIAGRKRAELAREFSLSEDAISRHARAHISARAAEQAPAITGAGAESIDVIGSVADLQVRVMRLLRQAETKRDVRGALAAVREAAGLLTLLGRLKGLIGPDGTQIAVQVNTSGTGVDAVRQRLMGKLTALAGGQDQGPLLIESTAE